ncbi:hypothetical protein M2364_002281 [Acinetobacter johnsonii]|nr:hypothetical protein [Acinetobacter johnsonii]
MYLNQIVDRYTIKFFLLNRHPTQNCLLYLYKFFEVEKIYPSVEDPQLNKRSLFLNSNILAIG